MRFRIVSYIVGVFGIVRIPRQHAGGAGTPAARSAGGWAFALEGSLFGFAADAVADSCGGTAIGPGS